MLSETELKILAVFFPEGTERTTKEIEDRSKYSHERVHSTLTQLEQKHVLNKRKIGKTALYSISRFADFIFLAFMQYSITKKHNFFEKYPLVLNALEDLIKTDAPDLVILFGSYPKGEAKKRSDVDVLCVGGSSKIEKTALSLQHRYNLKITPVVVKKRDFRNIKIENPQFWEDLIYSGIIIKGFETLYDLVYSPRK